MFPSPWRCTNFFDIRKTGIIIPSFEIFSTCLEGPSKVPVRLFQMPHIHFGNCVLYVNIFIQTYNLWPSSLWHCHLFADGARDFVSRSRNPTVTSSTEKRENKNVHEAFVNKHLYMKIRRADDRERIFILRIMRNTWTHFLCKLQSCLILEQSVHVLTTAFEGLRWQPEHKIYTDAVLHIIAWDRPTTSVRKLSVF